MPNTKSLDCIDLTSLVNHSDQYEHSYLKCCLFWDTEELLASSGLCDSLKSCFHVLNNGSFTSRASEHGCYILYTRVARINKMVLNSLCS